MLYCRRPFDIAGIPVTGGLDARNQLRRGHALYGIFPGRIDGGEHDRVRIIEAGGKFFHQAVNTRIAVRLVHGNDPAPASLACRPQEQP